MRALALTLTLLAAPAAAQTPNRFITYENQTWGYVQLEGDAANRRDQLLAEGPGSGVRPALRITILTRDGRPVTMADAEDAWFAANEICIETVRQFDPNARAILLNRGGLTFPGACS
jgi:protocatechuate 3,4-dioxygenase beta subunit